MPKNVFAKILINRIKKEESRRIENKRVNEQRKEAARQKRRELVKRAKDECNRVYSLYKKADEGGLLGTFSMEKAKNIFAILYRQCIEDPNNVLKEVELYESALAKNVKEVKTAKMIDKQIWESKARNIFMGGMEYMKYYNYHKENEKILFDLKLKDPHANTAAGLEYLKNQFPFPYNKCKFNEEEKNMFLSNPTQAKAAMHEMKLWGLI